MVCKKRLDNHTVWQIKKSGHPTGFFIAAPHINFVELMPWDDTYRTNYPNATDATAAGGGATSNDAAFSGQQ